METESEPRVARSQNTEIRSQPTPAQSPPPTKLNLRARIKKIPKRKLRIAIVASLIVIAAIGRFAYQFFTTESTDDSFVSAHVHAIGSRVIGTVEKVIVDENQTVKK